MPMLSDLARRFEAASAIYAAENGILRDDDWFLLKLVEEVGELIQVANRLSGRGRKKGMSGEELQRALADETADLLGHVLLLAHRHGIDLDAAIARKWRFAPGA